MSLRSSARHPSRPGLQPLTGWQRAFAGVMAVVFLAGGLSLLGGIVFGSIYGSWRTRSQVRADARMLSVELVSRVSGRTGVSKDLQVTYEYEVAGKSYIGSRVSLFRDVTWLYPSLSQAQHSGRRVPVYIDPDAPGFSVIDRSFSFWPLVLAVPFSLLFAAAGCFLVWACLKAPARVILPAFKPGR